MKLVQLSNISDGSCCVNCAKREDTVLVIPAMLNGTPCFELIIMTDSQLPISISDEENFNSGSKPSSNTQNPKVSPASSHFMGMRADHRNTQQVRIALSVRREAAAAAGTVCTQLEFPETIVAAHTVTFRTHSQGLQHFRRDCH